MCKKIDYLFKIGGGMMSGKYENLTANNASPEEIRERNSKAGKASAKARKRKKELKELLLLALSQPQEGKPEEDNYMGITVALIQKAIKGDTKAFEIIRDTIGQKPIEQLDINSNKININITGDEND